jgi:hypothetical protein
MWVSNPPTPLNSILDFSARGALHEVKVGEQTTKVVAICGVERDKPLTTAWPPIQTEPLPNVLSVWCQYRKRAHSIRLPAQG